MNGAWWRADIYGKAGDKTQENKRDEKIHCPWALPNSSQCLLYARAY